MEYLYLAMFLQEVGREINEVNIQKIFTALNIDVDNDKVRLWVTSLSILKNSKNKNTESSAELLNVKKLATLQNKFEALKNSISETDDRIARVQREKPVIHEGNGDNNTQDKASHELPARYVYAIADTGVGEDLGTIGLENSKVYTIPFKEMCIVVHDCTSEPYQSEDEEVVKNWLFTQQEVLDVVAERFGVVLPMSFDMIIEGKNGNDSDYEVKAWLEDNYEDFFEKINRLRNKQEFGIQITLDTEELSKKLIETDEKLRRKKEEIDTKPQGVAYMERELLKDLVKEKIEEKADQYFREFYGIIRKCADDIVIGKTKKVGGNKQMIMNLSCLVNKNKLEELGKELEKIEQKDSISVRFSGPWAPFSFVTPDKGGEK